MIDGSHLIWAVLLFCTTAAWVTVGQRITNPYVPYRTTRAGRQLLFLVSAALGLAMAAQGVGFRSLLAMESHLAAVWLGPIALAWFGRL